MEGKKAWSPEADLESAAVHGESYPSDPQALLKLPDSQSTGSKMERNYRSSGLSALTSDLSISARVDLAQEATIVWGGLF